MNLLVAERAPAGELAPPRWLARVGWAGLLLFLAAQAFGLLASPPDRDMGHLQKIMYVHVPSAWAAMLAFFAVFVFSILYLLRRRERDDLWAAAFAEAGVVLTALTLALGSLWGRPTWGVWWTWDPRLTTTAVLLVLYAGYLALRSFTDEPERRARWSAAVGVLAFLNVPVVYLSVRWWRTLHQVQSTPGTVEPAYAWSLRANAIAFLLLLVWLAGRRWWASVLEAEAASRAEARALGEDVVAGGEA